MSLIGSGSCAVPCRLECCPCSLTFKGQLMLPATVAHSQIGSTYLQHCAIVHTSTIRRGRKLVPGSQMSSELPFVIVKPSRSSES
jgi:hypothetical protein